MGEQRGRVNLDKQMHEIQRLRAEMSAQSPEGRMVTTRAVAQIIEDVHIQARAGKFIVASDEPLSRGGTDLGPSPSQYVMVGLAC